jgi:MATE family multidrug resistance protein
MLAVVFDDITASCYGILRGSGKAVSESLTRSYDADMSIDQDVAAKANVVAYWCVGIPTGLYLAFTGMGLVGLWIGNGISLFLTGTITTWCCVR